MKIVKAKSTTLAAPFSSTDTSFTLDSFVDSKGNALALSSFGSFMVVVLKQGDTVEMVKCSAIVQNASGSATFTVATNGRDLNPTSPYAGSSTGEDFQTGADALVTNDPYTMSSFAVLENDQTFTGANTFTQKLGVGAVTSSDTGKAATVDLVNTTALSGAPDSSTTVKGVTKMSVAPTSATAPIAVGDNDPRLPTQSENDALVGTSGTAVSSSNKLVDAADRTGGNLPAGTILPYAVATAPTGFLLCDGTAVSRTTYATLFAAISTTFGVGNGSTTFNVPDLRGRVPVGKNSATFSALGGTGGEETHTLITSEMPAHTHTVPYDSGGSGNNVLATALNGALGAKVSSSTGGDGAHNNLQPYLTVQYIIKT